jgi:hypothetical protein
VEHQVLMAAGFRIFSIYPPTAGIAQSVCSDQTTGWTADESWFDFRRGQETFLLSETATAALWTIQPRRSAGTMCPFPRDKTGGA